MPIVSSSKLHVRTLLISPWKQRFNARKASKVDFWAECYRLQHFFLKTLLSGLEWQGTLKISILPWCSPLTSFSFHSFGWSCPGGFLAWHRLGFCWVLPFFGWFRLWALFGISWLAPAWLLLLYGVASVWEHTVYSFVIITIGNILTFFKKKKTSCSL